MLKLIWVGLFVFIGYISYDVNGEASAGYLLIALFLTFPSGLLFMYIVRAFNSLIPIPGMSVHIENVVFDVFFFTVGYCQWFVLLPWLINKTNKTSIQKSGG